MDLAAIINNPSATLVDVRETYEFQSGHAKGAINIPLSELMHSLDTFRNLSRPIVVYCRSGNRSEHAKLVLQAKGITPVHNAGGLDEVSHYQAQAAFTQPA
jgi:rhodanese-related sulfurtransferase